MPEFIQYRRVMLAIGTQTTHNFSNHTVSISTHPLNNGCAFKKSRLEDTRVYVTICPRNVVKVPSQPVNGFAACIPPLYGNISTGEVSSYINYHKSIGIQHFFFYFTNCSQEQNIIFDDFRISTICTPWVNHVRKIHQRGQLFHMNDCIHRAASIGWKWVLLNDLDERLHVPFNFFNGRMDDVITFGSLMDNNITCIDPRYQKTPNFCLRWGGWRKMVVQAHSIWNIYVHFPDACVENIKEKQCNTTNVDANIYYIDHLRKQKQLFHAKYEGIPGG